MEANTKEFSKLVLKQVKHGNIKLLLKKPLILEILYEKYEDKTFYNISIADFGIYDINCNIQNLICSVSCDLYYLWTMYALEKDSKLSNDAKYLKYKLRNLISMWKIGNKFYCKYPLESCLNLPHNFNYNIRLTQKYFDKYK